MEGWGCAVSGILRGFVGFSERVFRGCFVGYPGCADA